VRLAAKLVKWRIDIKGQGESADLGASLGLFAPKKPVEEVNFLDLIKETKGLGEKIMAALFEGDVVSFEEALKRDKKGLTQLPGIGPKKAEAILELSEQYKPAPPEEPELPVEVEEPESLESEEVLTEDTADDETDETSEDVAEESEEEEDDEDIPVDELVDIDSTVIEILKQNEFQSLEELSVTPLEDLLAISGIDEETAQSILDQAKQRIGDLG
jgi:N utilization substance protein A